MRGTEYVTLLEMLPKIDFSTSLICKPLGVFSIDLGTVFVVLLNVSQKSDENSLVFDLKGSLKGREAIKGSFINKEKDLLRLKKEFKDNIFEYSQ